MMEGFFEGYKNQSLREKNRALEEKDEAIERWAAQEEELMERVARLEKTVKDREEAVLGWKAHYFGLEAERDYLLKLLDEAHGGAENNPTRKPAYKEGTFVLESGPRKGQQAEKRDHHYFTGMAEYIRSKKPQLGCWKKLIREFRIHI